MIWKVTEIETKSRMNERNVKEYQKKYGKPLVTKVEREFDVLLQHYHLHLPS